MARSVMSLHEKGALDQLFTIRGSETGTRSCIQNERILGKLGKHNDLFDEAVLIGKIKRKVVTTNSQILLVALDVPYATMRPSWSAGVNSDCETIPNTPSFEEYAIKSPYRREDFNTESRMLTATNPRKHEHIIELLSSFTWQANFCLLLAGAKMDLHAFWSKDHNELARDTNLLNWAMRQIYGLADAIRTIHCDLIENDTAVRGLHGDINPRNILLFHEPSQVLGTLKIADFGCSAITSDLAAMAQFEIEGNLGYYQSPESFQEEAITQACDMWEFGCLLLDFATWLRDGEPGLEAFAASRLQVDRGFGIEFENDFFFDLSSPTAISEGSEARVVRLNTATEKQLAYLKTKSIDPVICDLLSIIQQDLLKIGSEERISSTALVSKLRQLGCIDERRWRIE